MSFPGHLERLVKPHVHVDISGSTKHVSVAHFTRSRRSETAIGSSRIGEEVRSSVLSIPSRHRLQWLNANAVGLNVPVRRPNTAVERSLDRQTTVPTEDSGGGPAAQYAIDDAVRVTQEFLPTAKGQPDYPIRIDDVSSIKIRAGIVLVRGQRIDDERRTVAARGLQARSIVERMGQGVVEVKRYVFTEPLAQAELERVVIRTR